MYDTSRRPGLRDRMQDLHDRRTGDLVRDFYQLGAGSGVLDWEMFWVVVGKLGEGDGRKSDGRGVW